MRLTLILFLLLFITACSNQTINSNELYSDAEYLYNVINDNWQNKDYLNDTYQEYVNDFTEIYIKNYKDYTEEEQEIIKEMDKLINSHKLYFVSNGTQGEDVNNYEETINNSLKVLSAKFDK